MFLLIFLINTMINIGQQMVNTLVPRYAAELGATASMVGFISGVFSFSALLLRPFTSPALDCFDRKKLLFIATGIFGVAAGLYSLSDTPNMIIISRFLHGACYGCIGPLCLAIAADSLPASQIASGISIFTLAQAVAQSVGPGMGLWLQERMGYRAAFLGGLIMVVLALALMPFLRSSNQIKRNGGYKLKLNNIIVKEAVIPSITLFLIGIAQASIISFLVIYSDEKCIENPGIYFTVNAICLFLARPLSGKIADRYGSAWAIIPGLGSSMCAFVVLSLATSTWHLALAGALMAFGIGSSIPTIQALSMRLVPADRRGAGSNTNYIATDIGAMLGSYAGGLCIDIMGRFTTGKAQAISATYLLFILPLVGAGIFFVLYSRHNKRKDAMKLETH